MEQTLLEKLQNAKRYHGAEFICFFNNGEIKEDDLFNARRIKEAKDPQAFDLISEVLYKATESYARNYDFDRIDMDLQLGLIYKARDVEDGKIIDHREPIPGIVRIYTGHVNSYLDGEQTNKNDYYRYGLGRQSFISFNQLMKAIKKSGLDYIGPETFEELKEQILLGEPFDIKISANLNEYEDTTTTKVAKLR